MRVLGHWVTAFVAVVILLVAQRSSAQVDAVQLIRALSEPRDPDTGATRPAVRPILHLLL